VGYSNFVLFNYFKSITASNTDLKLSSHDDSYYYRPSKLIIFSLVSMTLLFKYILFLYLKEQKLRFYANRIVRKLYFSASWTIHYRGLQQLAY